MLKEILKRLQRLINLTMLKNLKTYMIIAAILIVGAAFVTVNIQAKKINALKADNARLETNVYQLTQDNQQITNLTLRQKEVTGRILRERDSLAMIVRVKPKFIDRIITIDNSTHDTVKVNVPAKPVSKNEWNITDSTECLKIAYNVKLVGDSLHVKRTLLESSNKTTQTFYKKRPHKFLGISYGRWQYLQKIDARCGGVKYESIVFKK